MWASLEKASFANVPYCIYVDVEKVQNYADVIYGWSPILIGTTRNIFSYAFTLQGGMKTKYFVFKKAANLITNCNYCFVHSTFGFWFLVTFGNKVAKIRKYYVIFVYILQGKMGKTEKNRKENHGTKVTKYQKPKYENI